MSAQTILSENWSDYERRKKEYENARFFSSEEEWEVDFLVEKIKEHYESLNPEIIKNAIQYSSLMLSNPRPRSLFVQCVMRRLGLE